jgi:hypothetical protein
MKRKNAIMHVIKNEKEISCITVYVCVCVCVQSRH